MTGVLETVFYSSPIVFFFSSYAFHFFLLLIKSYFQFYEISNEDTINYILSELGKNSSKRTESDKAAGLIIGFWYYCYMKEDAEKDMKLYLFCTKKMYKKIVEKVSELEENHTKKTKKIIIDHWVKIEKDWCCKYKKTLYDVTDFIPKKDQSDIISDIKKKYLENKNRLITIIHGKPGCGKSFIGFLLAKELKGSLCRTYNPTKSFNYLRNIYSFIEPTENKPLIIILDEIDIIFKKITTGIDTRYNSDPKEVIDKESWNRLCDDMQLGIYPNVIIIGTMNENPQNIDHSFIRENRVNILYKMGESIKLKKIRNAFSKFFRMIKAIEI